MFEKIEFYRVDISLLRSLGHEVVLAGRPRALDTKADAYYCWWWGHAPYAVALARLRGKPVIVTGAFDYATCRAEMPGLCYLDRPLWQRLVLQSMLRLADANLFISRYEYDEVTAKLPVRNPILAPLAVDTDFYKPSADENQSTASNSGYFFCVAWTSKPNAIRKGVKRTIEAFAEVATHHDAVRLKIAGKPGDFHAELQDAARRLGVSNRVDFLGLISDEEKRDHYRNCRAYVQPTLYEGFGLAIAEAIACGCPVITSNRGAVPEVVGNYGVCVDPHHTEDIASAMLLELEKTYTKSSADDGYKWIKSNFSLNLRKQRLQGVLAEAKSFQITGRTLKVIQ